jgi:hypothetical protein
MGDKLVTITDKTRKMLWGRSGNLCAICRQVLVIEAPSTDVNSVVGEECHIISGQENGPRNEPKFAKNLIDLYSNLLLLCSVHHKVIDDQWETYTVDVLHNIKTNNEKWVSEKLNDRPKKAKINLIKNNTPDYLVRVESGKELLEILNEPHSYGFDNDELNNPNEVEFVGGFFQTLQECGDLSSELESYDRVSVSFELTQLIRQLENKDFLVFGGIEIQELAGGTSEPSKWKVAIVQVHRSTNESIVKVQI